MSGDIGRSLDTTGSPVGERQALQTLLARYGLTLRGIGQRHRTVFTDRGPCQVRRFKGSWEELAFVAAALAHLMSRGFTALRRLCLTAGGEPGVRLGTGLFYLVAGEPGLRFDAGRRGEMSRAAELLAAFHRAGEGMPAVERGERVRYDRWPAVLQDRLADLQTMRREAVHSHGEFARLFAEYADDFLEQADRALTGLLASPLEEVRRDCAARRRLAHRRFTPARLRRLGQELLLDGWTHLALDLPVIDLARFVAAAARHDPDRAFSFLEAYDEVQPIAEGEWEVLLAWLRFPHDFWRLGHLHFHRRESHRTRLGRVIRHEAEREVFVETLALQWASRKLAPATRSGPLPVLPGEPGDLSEDLPSSQEEREATPVSEEEELMGIGMTEEPEDEDLPAQQLPVLELTGMELPVEEVVGEPVAAIDVATEPVDLESGPAGEPPAELEIPAVGEPVAAVEEHAPAIKGQTGVIVWKPFPPPLTPR